MNEMMDTQMNSVFDGGQTATCSAEMVQREHVVICGLCGAVERPLGPHKSECPNCDDYIY
ncbi:hypothetical protein [Paracnuella aquatica]|uniref:hypothetical protein n=1 Tax=Paracnuella aquatica TaxID=2268757 RepID=UPI000DEEF48F|nr:hypothetical protein [Paracnuella aquatica]RPD44798.1 hypothetical protein DRJ53_16720 [Paracnuella aquatica]